MATDRTAVLTIAAAARKVVDFSKARFRDPQWWRRLRILLEAVASEREIELRETEFRLRLALVGKSDLAPEAKAELAAGLKNDIEALTQLYCPWLDAAAKPTEQELDDLSQTFIHEFGDYRDPAWQAKLAAELAELRATRNAQAAVESDEARIERLEGERADKLDKQKRRVKR